jgi:putative iron-dependent peroxidase
VAHPQAGIFALGTRSHHHLEFAVAPDADPHDLVPAVNRVREAATTVAGVNLVVGFGHRTWSRIAPEHAPVDLGPFEPITGAGGFEIPAGQHDLWLWLHAAGPDSVFNIARLAALELVELATVVAEHPAFTYQASQDLTGFEDGTENPALDEASSVATIPEGQRCEGGSIVLLQKWVHDLDGIEALELSDREQVIGRTLQGSVELSEDVRSPRSHISRVVIEDDAGEELEVFRRSTAFGGVKEHGLMFLAFSADRARLHRMLVRMSGAEDGVRDRLTEFSTPVASAWYVAPPIDLLRELDPSS